MEKALFYTQVFLSTAISSSLLRHFATFSASTGQASVVILLLVIFIWVALFLADDRLCKWQKVDLAAFRFAMTGIAAAIIIGLAVPMLPALLGG